MRIVHVVPTYFPAIRYGGPIYSVHGLCRALVRRGHRVDVVTTNVDGDLDSDVPIGTSVDLDGVSVSYFRSRVARRMNLSWALARALWNRMGSYDVAHIHSMFSWPTLAASRVAVARRVPYLLSPRGSLVKSLVAGKSKATKDAWLWLFDRQTLKGATAIHLASEREREELEAFGLALARTVVIPNGVDVGASAPREGSDGTILYLGRISWEKGLDRLIPAMQFVPNGRLIVAGGGESDLRSGLEKCAREKGVQDRVEFVGAVSGPAKDQLLKRASVLVLASYSENFGNVVLEALATGCPVVVTPGVGLASAIARSGAGIVTEGSPEALGTAMQAFISDAALRDRCGKAGYELVKREFTWDAIAKAMEDQYDMAVQQQSHNV